MTEPRLTRWVRSAAPRLKGVGATALLAVLCNLGLELTQLAGVQGHLWEHKTPFYPVLFLLNSMVLWLVIGLIHAVVGRISVTAGIAALATAVIAVADHEKVRFRREPLYPSDWEFLSNAGFLADVVGARVVFLLALGILFMAVLAFAGVRAVLRRWPEGARQEQDPPSRRKLVLVRLATGVVCLLLVGYASDFNNPGNAVRGAYDALGASWKPWSQQRNYLGNGFVGGFLYNLDVPPMSAPPGYSAAEMDRIAARYGVAADRINRTRDPDGLDDVNVVVVLSESFSDPMALHGVGLPGDPIPFTRRLMGSTMSGKTLSQHIGGGTANMEFEALTGMSMSLFPPQIGVPYQMLVPDYETFPSAVQWFEQHGHRSMAIHPFTTEMYRRREVYRSFGFDEFVYDETMRHHERIGHDAYISDAAAFDELHQRLLEEAEPLFVNLVTMQNHAPYTDKYDDPVHVTDPDGEPIDEVDQYVRGLTHSDQALEDLISRLDGFDEKTVVVFYGDHLPGIYPGSVFAANDERALLETPFFVWANFRGPGGEQPVTSPTHFMDLVFERAGAAVPPYFALLHELRQEVPAMDNGMMFDPSSRPLRRGDLSRRAARLLHDYRLVQYDLSVGRRYSAEAMFGEGP